MKRACLAAKRVHLVPITLAQAGSSAASCQAAAASASRHAFHVGAEEHRTAC